MEKKIAVRFYENKKFGSTYGKGLYRTALYNGTADLEEPHAKYLLDMFGYADWENTARTANDMELLTAADEVVGTAPKSDFLATWIKRWDADGTKPRVFGFAVLDLNTHQLTLLINDDVTGVENAWALEAKPCKQASDNRKSPNVFASNADLG